MELSLARKTTMNKTYCLKNRGREIAIARLRELLQLSRSKFELEAKVCFPHWSTYVPKNVAAHQCLCEVVRCISVSIEYGQLSGL